MTVRKGNYAQKFRGNEDKNNLICDSFEVLNNIDIVLLHTCYRRDLGVFDCLLISFITMQATSINRCCLNSVLSMKNSNLDALSY